jgi:GNAT superfamily N-acetyltransferase
MKYEVSFRMPTIQDYTSINRLLQEISAYEPAENHEYIFRKFISQPHIRSLVMMYDCSIIGFGYATVHCKFRGGLSAILEDIVVARGFQSMGFGKLLVSKLVELCHDSYKVSLICKLSNSDFYKKLGFEQNHVEMRLLRHPCINVGNNASQA